MKLVDYWHLLFIIIIIIIIPLYLLWFAHTGTTIRMSHDILFIPYKEVANLLWEGQLCTMASINKIVIYNTRRSRLFSSEILSFCLVQISIQIIYGIVEKITVILQ